MFKNNFFKRKKKKHICDLYKSTEPIISPEEEEERHLKKLERIAANMNEDEYEVILEHIPIHLVMRRIADEINMKQIMEMRIKELEGLIKGGDQNG